MHRGRAVFRRLRCIGNSTVRFLNSNQKGEVTMFCPKCGKRLLEKVSKRNRKFYGCEGYPDCDFVSWDRPVAERCPKCGSTAIRMTAGREFYVENLKVE